jgi:hypothetical protein
MTANARKGAIAALFAVIGLSVATGASAETARPTVHHHKHAVVAHLAPLPPGVELRTSTYASPGSENHYYSDTVASSHSDLMDMSYRYGQASPPLYNNTPDPLFQF